MKTVRKIIVLVLILTLVTSLTITPCSATVLLLGDANGDGEVCITDATRIQRDVAQIIKIEDSFRQAADVDSDSIISIMDATAIQRWLVHFSVAHPIGESMNISIPTEEKEPTPTVPSTETSTVSTEASSQPSTVIRNDKTVTVDGTEFNISRIPDAVTLDNSSGNTASFMLRNKALPDPADIHIEVISDNQIIRIDYSDERYKETYLAELNGKAIGCDYLIRDNSGNDIAWLSAHFTNGVYPYQVSITGFNGRRVSFSVDFYYRDVLLKRTSITVDLSVGYGYADETKSIVRKIESKCWTRDMTNREKMKAFAEYIKSHYTLHQLKCVDGALYTALAARDLELDAMLFYPEENGHPDLITYNLYYNTTVPGGHCACLVEYDDCTMRYDVQGQACVIRPYLP